MRQAHPFRSEEAKQAYLAHYDEKAERWPVKSEEGIFPTSFGETFVRISGPEKGPPVVLLPGDAENSLSWVPQIPTLVSNYRVFAVDQIYDNGRSVYTRRPEKPTDFVEWLDELLGALRLDETALIGHSYGGWLASLYALAHPDRLNKLVLIAPTATVLKPSLGLLIRAIVYYFVPLRFITRRYLYWYAPDSVRNEETRKIIDEMIEEQVLAKRCFKRRKFIAPTVLSGEDWQRLRTPTLFVVGDREMTYSGQKAIQHLRSVAPHIQALLVPGGDHHLAMARPDPVNETVLAFLMEKRA